MQKKIKLSPPNLGAEEEKALIKVLRSGYIVQGKVTHNFERKFADYIGTRYAVAFNNGTSALIALLLASDIKAKDEVISTPFTFGATANSILAVGAKIKFADIDSESYCIDPRKVVNEITKKTRAILAVDLFGQCADWTGLYKIAKSNNLLLIEDAAQAHGASIGGKKAGTFGIGASFSFYASKNMTTAEGGMITTDSMTIYKKLLLLRNHGMVKKYQYQSIGFNFRLTDLQSALGLVQLAKLDRFNSKRQANARYLSTLLKNIPGIIVPRTKRHLIHVFHQYVILVKKPFSKTRDQLADFLYKKGIETAIHYPYPLHVFPIYKQQKKKTLPISERVASEILSLPVHPLLSKKDIQYIAAAIITAR